MKCNVPYCTSDSSRPAKCSGITFHSFPKDPNISKAWVEALGTINWSLKDKTFICSEHFNEADFYETQDGNRKLYSTALPVEMPYPDTAAAFRVCRICLVMNAKMYDFRRYYVMFEQITGVSACDASASMLPQCVCWECASRLTAAANFRAKALLSNGLLQDILKKNSYLTIRDIKSINRTHHRLKSNLVQNIFDSKFFVEIDGVIDTVDTDVLKIDNIKTEEPTIDQSEDLPTENKTNNFVKIKEQIVSKNNYIDEGNISEELSLNDTDNSDTDEGKELKPVSVEIESKIQVLDDYDTDEKELEPEAVILVSKLEDTDDECDIEFEDIYKHLLGSRINENIDNKVPSQWVTTKMQDLNRPIETRRPSNFKAVDETLFTITPISLEQEMLHMQKRQDRTAYKNSKFKCTICFTGFLNNETLSRHSMKHSAKAGAYECRICKMRWKKKYILRRHMLQHSREYSCNECEFVTRHKTAVTEHTRYHAGTKYQCSKCLTSFGKRSTYLSHLRLSHTTDFVCELCGYTFVNEKGVNRHKNIKHRYDQTKKLEGPHCDICNVTFLSEHAHDTHLRVSAKHLKNENDPMRIRNELYIKVTKPNEDGTTNQRSRDLSGMSQKDENNVPVDCEQCGLSLRNFHAYSRHFDRAHPEAARTQYRPMKYPTMCEQCGKIFQSAKHLEMHKWVHTGQKQFQCEHCNKAFTQKPTLVQHMLRHTGDKSANKCPQCDKYFTFYSNLKRHMFLHTGLKPFKCDLCEKCYATSDQLKLHVHHFHLNNPWPKKKKKNKQECIED